MSVLMAAMTARLRNAPTKPRDDPGLKPNQPKNRMIVPRMPSAEAILPYLRRVDANRHYTNFGPLNAEFEARLKEPS